MKHTHEFELPTPNGPTSVGTCRICGSQKTHRNSLPSDTKGSWKIRYVDYGRKVT